MKSLILAKRPDVTKATLRKASVEKENNEDDLYIDTITIGARATVTDVEGNSHCGFFRFPILKSVNKVILITYV